MKRNTAETFWAQVDKTDTCWLWRGTINKGTGYGLYWLDGFFWLGHRLAYTLVRGAIPAGLVVDHLCRVRHCVNPDHLEAVTQGENIRRGEPARRTHCPSGHAYDAANTRVYAGKRHCVSCQRERATAARRRRGVPVRRMKAAQ